MSAENDKLLYILEGNKYTIFSNQEWISNLIPEIKPMIGMNQHNPNHSYDVWEHTVISIVNAPNNPILRLTMLFHDIGKPKCYTVDENGIGHFYGHPKESCHIANSVLNRLNFDASTISLIDQLIFYHDAQIPSKSVAVKRWLGKLEEEVFRMLLEVKRADVMAQSEAVISMKIARIDLLEQKLDQVVATSRLFGKKDLAVNGRDIMNIGITQGMEIGAILNYLVNLVIADKVSNTKEELMKVAESYKNTKGGCFYGNVDYFNW